MAENEDQYIQKATHLANNIDELTSIREKIFSNILSTPLYDSHQFAEGLKNELLKVYKRNL